MSEKPLKVPFVNLSLQHKPIQSQIEQVMGKIIQQGDFILGEALAEFELIIHRAKFGEAGNKVVVESFLEGIEVIVKLLLSIYFET